VDSESLTTTVAIITIGLSIAASIGAGVSYFIGRKEKAIGVDAQSAAHISDAYSKLVEDLVERVAILEDMCKENILSQERNKLLTLEVGVLKKEREKLSAQVEELSKENRFLKSRMRDMADTLMDMQKKLKLMETENN